MPSADNATEVGGNKSYALALINGTKHLFWNKIQAKGALMEAQLNASVCIPFDFELIKRDCFRLWPFNRNQN